MMFSGLTKGLGLSVAAAAAIALAPVMAQADDYSDYRIVQQRQYGAPESFQVADSRRYGPGRRHYRRLGRHFRRHHRPWRHRHGGHSHYYYYERHSHHGSILGALVIGTMIGAMVDAVDSGPDYVVTPAPAAPPPSPTVVEQAPEQYCREYQTTVIVGGEHQTAYGTACRQPDGSWRRIPD